MGEKKKISIVTCCYNEAGNIKKVYEEVKKVFEKLPQYDYEHLFEDNDSTDGTQDILREIAQNDCKVKVIFNGQNYGPLYSGLHSWTRVSGDALIGIVADLQDPPEIIPQLLEKWEEGYKIVLGQKIESHENKVMYMTRTLYYSIIKKLSDAEQLPHVTGFGLYDKEAVKTIVEMGDDASYMRGFLTQMGFKYTLVPYTQNKREWGKSSYNFSKYLDYAFEGLTQTTRKPLRIVTILGFTMSVISLILAIVYLIYKLIFWERFQAGMSPILIGMFLFSSVQMLCIGLIGEYVGQIVTKVSKRPRFIEAETINIDKKTDNVNEKQ